MFEYEKCIQEVKEAGIEFTEAEKTYIRSVTAFCRHCLWL